ncbi:hypothetical protein DH2020_046953 [Rehmannia glutinosa]|uniref:Uncharacterized protein n=1 Tax=Rehmannia glutinosa TaxID=99300 RepID=A0ABR0UAW3_REHGL
MMTVKDSKDVKSLKEDDNCVKVEGAASNERVHRWNLRDRNSIQLSKAVREKDKQPMTTGESCKGKIEKQEEDLPKLPNFSLELKIDEIKEDLFAVTGKLPSRKVNKRQKNVQKQIDLIFPGGYLETITVDRQSKNVVVGFIQGLSLFCVFGSLKAWLLVILLKEKLAEKLDIMALSDLHDGHGERTKEAKQLNRWNLRDRKSKVVREKDKQPKMTKKNGNGKMEKQEEKYLPNLPNFSLELEVDEISEYLFAVTGKMPSKNMNKRERNVQKQIDVMLK